MFFPSGMRGTKMYKAVSPTYIILQYVLGVSLIQNMVFDYQTRSSALKRNTISTK